MYIKLTLMMLLLMAGTVDAGGQDNDQPATIAKGVSQQEEDSKQGEPDLDEDSTIEKGSFLIGFNLVTRLRQQEAVYDIEKLLDGITAAHEDREVGMDQDEMRSVMQAYTILARKMQQVRRERQAETNEAEGIKALEEFARQEGAQELEDGVMYLVLKEGDGEIPEAADQVKLHYHGTYVNGEVFDSSVDKGDPIVNGVTRFVPGFSNALQKMKVGSKWKVIIRGDKAYGMNARPPMEINKTLLFEIELLAIQPIE